MKNHLTLLLLILSVTSSSLYAQKILVNEDVVVTSPDKTKKMVFVTTEDQGAWLGVEVSNLDDETKGALGTDQENGAVVKKVFDDTPAEEAGIEPGDIIVKLDDREIDSSSDLIKALKKYEAGDKAVVEVLRDGDRVKMDVTLGERSDDQTVVVKGRPQKHIEIMKLLNGNYLGVQVQELDEDLAAYFDVKADEGLLITRVEEGTPAEEAGLKSGDILVTVGGQTVLTAQDIRDVLGDYEEGEEVDIEYIRKGKKAQTKAEVESRENFSWTLPGGHDFNIDFDEDQFKNLGDKIKIQKFKFDPEGEMEEAIEEHVEEAMSKVEEALQEMEEKLEKMQDKLDEIDNKVR